MPAGKPSDTILAAERRLRARELGRTRTPQSVTAARFPLSFSQERMWKLQQLDPDSGYYNIVRQLRFEGDLNVSALRRTLQTIIERHGTLRTTLHSGADLPFQVVHAAPSVELETVDVPNEETFSLRFRAFVDAPFQLDTSFPYRFRLYRLSPHLHYLALVFHHAAIDGWSLRLVSSDLERFYLTFANGQTPDGAPPAMDYPSFGIWHRQFIESGEADGQYEFWQQHLQGVPPALALPLDRLRPSKQNHCGSQQRANIPLETSRVVRQFAKSHGISVFPVLLAAFQVILARYSQQDDFVVGIPGSGRTHPELESVAGCFVNTLPIRSSVPGDPAFGILVDRIRTVLDQAVAHQDVPYELLMDRMEIPRLQILFAQQAVPLREIELAGLRCTLARAKGATSRCDMAVAAGDRGAAGLELEIEYDTDLFDASTIRRLLSHYVTLLDFAAAHPDTEISRLPLMDEAERHLVRHQFNTTTRHYPQEPVHVLFEKQAQASPDRPAIVNRTDRLTYAQLNEAANRIANHLIARGIGPGSLIAISLSRTVRLPAAMLGIWKTGAAWLPLDPADPERRVQQVLADSRTTLHLKDQDLDEAWKHADATPPPARGSATDLAYVMYTSGSTGRPKGVEIPHRAIIRLVVNTNHAQFGPEETFLAVAPMTFDVSLWELWGALLHGSKCVLYPERVPEPRALKRLIDGEGITSAVLTSSVFNAILDELPEAFTGLRQLLVGGEVLSIPHIRRAAAALSNTTLINAYGPTESTTIASAYKIPRDLPERLPSIPIGSPIANTRLYVLDSHHQPCPIGVPGELWIGGDGLAVGYRGSPQLTAERFIESRWGERLYRSGDAARWREGGILEFLGRTDSQIKVHGVRIEPAEIENALAEHPDVETSLVVAIEDTNHDRRLAAYVQPRPGANISDDELRAHLRDRLPLVLHPAWYVLVPEIPRNVNGKRDATGLPRPGPQRRVQTDPPQGATQKRVMEIVQGLLPAAPSPSGNLFDAGLHSLLASRLIAQVGNAFNFDLPLGSLYANPTVEGIAAALDRGSAVPGVSVCWNRGKATPFFFCHASPELKRLAELLDDRPFYGVGFSGWGEAPRTIEEHASAEVATILRVNPRGPYLIGGWSASGVLAFEVAQQLTRQGSEVALVVLIEAPNYEYMHGGPTAARWIRRARSLYYELRYLKDAKQNDTRLFLAAARNYRPQPYNGRVLLLKRTERAKEWGSEDLGWKEIVKNLEIVPVGGNHMTVFQDPHVEGLATILRDHFQCVLEGGL